MITSEHIILMSLFYAFTKIEDFYFGYHIKGDGSIIGPKGSALKPRMKRRRLNSGVDVCYRIKNKEIRIHRLMAHVFLGMPLRSKKHVNHLDKNTCFNHLFNLEIVTPKRNMRHRSGHYEA